MGLTGYCLDLSAIKMPAGWSSLSFMSPPMDHAHGSSTDCFAHTLHTYFRNTEVIIWLSRASDATNMKDIGK